MSVVHTRAFVFDFDGVIANSEPLHYRGYCDVLAREGVTLRESDYYERYLGYDDVGAFEALATDNGLAWSAEKIAELVARKAVRLEELEREGSVLFPGASEAIARLAAVFPLAIASGALGHEIRRVVDRTGLAPFFKTIVAAEDTPASKPAPDPYVRAVANLNTATALNLRPEECIAIEDSVWGLRSARAAGLRTIAITHSYPRDVLVNDADDVIANLDALTVDYVRSLDRAARRTSLT